MASLTSPVAVSDRVETSTTWRMPAVAEIAMPDFPARLAHQLDELLGCAVWLTCQNRRGQSVEAVASRTAQSYEMPPRTVESIASDATQASGPISMRCPKELPASPSAIMDQAWKSHPQTSALSVSVPMREENGSWVITLAWRDQPDQIDAALRYTAWLDLYSVELSQALEYWSIHRNGKRYQSWVKRWEAVRRCPRPWMIALVAGLGMAMLIPIPYRPKRDCVMEPSLRRFVASPIEGRLKSIQVRPGEEVITGQLLGRIDDTQILRDLAIAEAELETQNKKREVALAARAAGDLRLAQLECQLVQLKIDSLNDQLQRLEIVSPSDGVIVQGDWYGNEGMPVSFGQTLFEIAPLNQMIAEIQLKAEDLPWVHVGSKAILRTDSSLHEAWRGVLARIEPHAEVIEEEAVFIGEMEVSGSDHSFRPGMKAKVIVDAGYKTIGWILFRKPYQWLQNQWVW